MGSVGESFGHIVFVTSFADLYYLIEIVAGRAFTRNAHSYVVFPLPFSWQPFPLVKGECINKIWVVGDALTS